MSEAAIVLFVLLFLLLFSSTPIAVALGLATFAYFFYYTTIPLTQVPETLFNALNTFPLMAIPMFVLAATIMSRGGISDRLTKAGIALVGQFRGGLAMTAVLSCIFFAAISGSSPATVVAVGTLMIPAMINSGYGKDFSTGLIATSGSLGILIPPSIPLIVYGIATEQSIGDLFIAGILPGLIAGAMLLLMVVVVSRRRQYGTGEHAISMTRKEKVQAVRDSALSLLLPLLVLGGIYGGIFTPTEASGVAVAYSLVVGALIYRELTWKSFLDVMRDTVIATSVIMLIIAAAALFSFLLSRTGLPAAATAWVQETFTDRFTFLLAVNLFLFVIGMFIETAAAILVLAPILVPIAVGFGVDPVHFGLIMVVNLALGMITPPVGVNLFAACQVARLPIERIVPALLPFFAVIGICVLLVTYVPWISLGLRDLLY
jgi:C4-dicarboxylate transporter, DctM subunit